MSEKPGKYGEPWDYHPDEGIGVKDADGYTVPITDVDDEVAYRRAVACVNALAGLDPEALAGLVEAATRCASERTVDKAPYQQCVERRELREALAAFRQDTGGEEDEA